MSVASEIERLQNAKADLKTSINAKTDSSHQIDDEAIDEYADFVDSIQIGGGGVILKPSVDIGAKKVNELNGVTTNSMNPGIIIGYTTNLAFTKLSTIKGLVFIFVRSNYTLSNNLTLIAETDWYTASGTTQKLIVCWCENLTGECSVTQANSGRCGMFTFAVKGGKQPTSTNVILNEARSSQQTTLTVHPTDKLCIYIVSGIYNVQQYAGIQLDTKFDLIDGAERFIVYVSNDSIEKQVFLSNQAGTGIIGLEVEHE